MNDSFSHEELAKTKREYLEKVTAFLSPEYKKIRATKIEIIESLVREFGEFDLALFDNQIVSAAVAKNNNDAEKKVIGSMPEHMKKRFVYDEIMKDLIEKVKASQIK